MMVNNKDADVLNRAQLLTFVRQPDFQLPVAERQFRRVGEIEGLFGHNVMDLGRKNTTNSSLLTLN